MTFCSMCICSDTLHWSDMTLTSNLVTQLDIITDFDLTTNSEKVSIEHLQRVQHANRGHFIFHHLMLSHLGLACVLMLRPVSPLSLYHWRHNIRISITHGTIMSKGYHLMALSYCFISLDKWSSYCYCQWILHKESPMNM